MFRTEVDIQAVKTVTARDTGDGSPAELPLFVARPAAAAGEKRPALVLIQEVFGVNPHIQDVCKRFAAAGYVVAAPDLFYRSEPWLSFNYTQFQETIPHVRRLNEDLIMGDVEATMAYLAAQPDVDASRIGTVGYCMGGRVSLVSAIRLGERVRATAVYYGGGIVSPDPNAPVGRVGAIKCPVIAFFGEKDAHIPGEAVRQLEQALSDAGVANDVYYYPDTDHGFFCDARASFGARAAEDAWCRTLAFFERNLGPVPAVKWKG